MGQSQMFSSILHPMAGFDVIFDDKERIDMSLLGEDESSRARLTSGDLIREMSLTTNCVES